VRIRSAREAMDPFRGQQGGGGGGGSGGGRDAPMLQSPEEHEMAMQEAVNARFQAEFMHDMFTRCVRHHTCRLRAPLRSRRANRRPLRRARGRAAATRRRSGLPRSRPRALTRRRPPRSLTSTCFQKCVPRFRDSDLSVGEASCVDRCTLKFIETQNMVGEKLGKQNQQQK
jgi:hypothetical protein